MKKNKKTGNPIKKQEMIIRSHTPPHRLPFFLYICISKTLILNNQTPQNNNLEQHTY